MLILDIRKYDGKAKLSCREKTCFVFIFIINLYSPDTCRDQDLAPFLSEGGC